MTTAERELQTDELARQLEIFNERVGRIRGKTFEDKIVFLRDRYLKTALDCRKEADSGNDTSGYRAGYALVHETVGEMLVDWDESPEYMEQEVVQFLIDSYRDAQIDRTNISVGQSDAYLYIICELRRAMEGANV